MTGAMPRSAFDFLPEELDYEHLRHAAAACEGCDLYKNATQTVFGEGPTNAKLMLVGETPGDEEDIKGHPFVGPAGRLLERAMDHAGIERGDVYLTNVVKHFKWKPAGKRRLHQKPSAREQAACEPWLRSEIILVQPQVMVCLGSTAAQSVFGKDFRVTQSRGQWFETEFAPRTIATWHPSAVLRAPDAAAKDTQYTELVDDLILASREVSRLQELASHG